jgi:hypothetical protein
MACEELAHPKTLRTTWYLALAVKALKLLQPAKGVNDARGKGPHCKPKHKKAQRWDTGCSRTCLLTISTFDHPNAMVHLVCTSTFKYCHLPWSTSYTLYHIFHQWLSFGERLAHSLICPKQLRSNGITISDVPKQIDQNFKHSIDVPNNDFTLPHLLAPITIPNGMPAWKSRGMTSGRIHQMVKMSVPFPINVYLVLVVAVDPLPQSLIC